MKAFLFSSVMKVHCNLLRVLEKHTLQNRALFMVDISFMLVVSEEIASEIVGDE